MKDNPPAGKAAQGQQGAARQGDLRSLLAEKLRITRNGSISIIKQDSRIVQINVSETIPL
ncbi:MAG: YezD family protein [Treponema sp.]|jgi:hypothetical protein|nr:YezD family protein [Treponema sp.]